MKVEVKLRTPGGIALLSTIERVGPGLEQVPSHQLRDHKIPEWGQPIIVAMPSDVELRPGELVDIRFRRE